MRIIAAKSLLRANDQIAVSNRERFDARGAFAVNLVGSPGAGKTSLLEALFQSHGPALAPCVIEGDVAGHIDAERMQQLGVPVVQIETQGMCHLEAHMIDAVVDDDFPGMNATLFIENVGNLVCTAGYDLGEHLRITVLSVPEGDDKLVKYPAIFQRSDLVVVTKTDLLGPCPFDPERVARELRQLAPAAQLALVSASNGEGVAELAAMILARRRQVQSSSNHAVRS